MYLMKNALASYEMALLQSGHGDQLAAVRDAARTVRARFLGPWAPGLSPTWLHGGIDEGRSCSRPRSQWEAEMLASPELLRHFYGAASAPAGSAAEGS
jgi:hypothetical protein